MLSYENGIATDNLPNEYYVVQSPSLLIELHWLGAHLFGEDTARRLESV